MTGGMTGEFTQLLLGLCAGGLLAMAAAMLRAPRATARWTGFAFFFTSALFAVKLWCDMTGALPPGIMMVVRALAASSIGWFWLMVLSLFDDRDEFAPVMFLAPVAPAVVLLLHEIPEGPLLVAVWVAGMLVQIGLTVASLLVVVRSWTGDLVESRRRVRGPFMALVALYILSIAGFDIWAAFEPVPAWYPMLNASMLTVCVLAGAFTFVEARGAMFGDGVEPASRPPEPLAQLPAHVRAHAANGQAGVRSPPPEPASALALDRAAKADLDRLERLMAHDQVWKEEGLTIASLALRASMPETQLRRLISDCLGYRNFPSYVNSHRIAAAKDRLADPDEARVSISTIAYDIGFASLGPFNRAFRQEAGVSPSEWRRRALGLDSPIPETA